tara:strand:+ start:598 stop:1545 length:948 start_codon:yes stop_codon:yes gene_type:complete
MKYIINKSTNLFSEPFPYIVQDNFLNSSLLEEVKENWPDESYFYDEIEGIQLIDLMYSAKSKKIITTLIHVLTGNLNYMKTRKFLQKNQKKFWSNFVDNELPKINETIYDCFKDILCSKFENINSAPGIEMINLMQANEKFNGHGIHNHHYHNPNWTYTMLLYIDDNEIETQGTDIYTITKKSNKNYIDNITDFALNHRIIPEPEGLLDEKKTIDFKNNRLFAFLDTPISYHGVTHGKIKNTNPLKFPCRKIIRLHAKYDSSYVKKLFGYNLRNYSKMRANFCEKINLNDKTNLENPEHLIHKGIKKELTKLLKQ